MGFGENSSKFRLNFLSFYLRLFTKTLYHARNTLLTVYKSVVVVFFFQMGYMYLVEWEKKFLIVILLASASIALKEKKIIASWVVD